MKLQNLFVLLALLYLTGCTASFQFTKGDADGEKDGFVFGGVYASDADGNIPENVVTQISPCSLEALGTLPTWSDEYEWTENSPSLEADNQGSLFVYVGGNRGCHPRPPDYHDNFVFFIKSPDLENDSGWQDLSSFTAHVNYQGRSDVKVQLQAKVRKANGDEVFWFYKDSNGFPAFVSSGRGSWLPIVFEMESEPVTLLFISIKVLGNADQINFGGGDSVFHVDGIFAKK